MCARVGPPVAIDIGKREGLAERKGREPGVIGKGGRMGEELPRFGWPYARAVGADGLSCLGSQDDGDQE